MSGNTKEPNTFKTAPEAQLSFGTMRKHCSLSVRNMSILPSKCYHSLLIVQLFYMTPAGVCEGRKEGLQGTSCMTFLGLLPETAPPIWQNSSWDFPSAHSAKMTVRLHKEETHNPALLLIMASTILTRRPWQIWDAYTDPFRSQYWGWLDSLDLNNQPEAVW